MQFTTRLKPTAGECSVNRIAILTAGGDTPALNSTLHGAVARTNKLRVEVYGLIKGYDSLLNPRVRMFT